LEHPAHGGGGAALAQELAGLIAQFFQVVAEIEIHRLRSSLAASKLLQFAGRTGALLAQLSKSQDARHAHEDLSLAPARRRLPEQARQRRCQSALSLWKGGAARHLMRGLGLQRPRARARTCPDRGLELDLELGPGTVSLYLNRVLRSEPRDLGRLRSPQ